MTQPRQLFQNEHYTVLVDERLRLVRSIRSDKPFASIQELEGSVSALCEALDGLERAKYSILSDVRAVPGRNDPEFEAALHRLRPRWLGGFRKAGVLVKTAVGLLQVQRYARQDGIQRLVTNDEDELLAYLTQE